MKSHFIALGLAIINALFKNFTIYSLLYKIEVGIELYAAFSGLILFFFNLRPFRNINIYFLFYALAAFCTTMALVFKGIFWGLVCSIILFPIIPNDVEFEDKDIFITSVFNGMMGRRDTFEIKERQYLILEKELGIWEQDDISPINFETVKIITTEFEIKISYSVTSNDQILHKIIKKNSSFFAFKSVH